MATQTRAPVRPRADPRTSTLARSLRSSQPALLSKALEVITCRIRAGAPRPSAPGAVQVAWSTVARGAALPWERRRPPSSSVQRVSSA